MESGRSTFSSAWYFLSKSTICRTCFTCVEAPNPKPQTPNPKPQTPGFFQCTALFLAEETVPRQWISNCYRTVPQLWIALSTDNLGLW